MTTQQWIPEQTASIMQTWQAQVKRIIESSSPEMRTVLVGMGHPLRSDDYAGSYIVKRLIAHAERKGSNGVFLFDGEDNVENLITTIARLEPKHVIFIDACEMKENPGTVSLIPVSETSFPFFTTHGVPIKLLANQILTGSTVWILAIQPGSTDFGEQLSTNLRVVADSISDFLATTLKERNQLHDS